MDNEPPLCEGNLIVRMLTCMVQSDRDEVAFSYLKSERDIVIKYIMNQEEHHGTKSFKDEYIKMLVDFDVAYQDKYLFEFYN